MNNNTKKVIKEMQKREQIKQEALKKGWRSRFTLLFKAWLKADYGLHLEWLGFYDEAQEVRSKYKMGLKEYVEFTTEATLAGISLVSDSGTPSPGLSSPIMRLILSMIYTATETTKILFGAYKQDAFGLPVCWTAPKQTNGNGTAFKTSKNEPIVVNTLSDDNLPK